MSLASGILFMIWCSIVFFAIGGWVVMTITRQDKTIYHDWDDEIDEFDDEEDTVTIETEDGDEVTANQDDMFLDDEDDE